ncbi:WecB/TagA/CpsF family glycosyltransferase [Paracidobacterium acidisoli]|uniref:Glycosyltransferase n=1 Tax=Paracidobacterium acidisoli TaxID=2303751 RepID=A0A372IL91_9BACT|nr:WecB/TagA/CpsF family glycosyltransferase [Paracidobacterium acidisoli]MBT9332707.1 WecB/TagA/CpsF family glycosyltransferase [Paracidobacterium acidisoli]
MKSHRGYRQILGIRFYAGDIHGALERMRHGGLLVVPAAPALKDLATNPSYREALIHADVAITDSAFMVMIWNLLERDSIRRLSGLEYLRGLLQMDEVRKPCETLWIMAGPANAKRNLEWLEEQGILVPEDYVYMAPMYGGEIQDEALLARLRELRPKHIIITVGGGTQERLGLYLKRSLEYTPSIHCIGAAIAFLSGDQVRIPAWADKLYLGWLFRCFSAPGRYVPRYWEARKLLPLMVRHRSQLPGHNDREVA